MSQDNGTPSRCPFTNPDVNSPNLCTGDIEYLHYNYNPHQWVCALFVALFAATSIAHLFQAIRGKRWYMLGTIFIAAICECMGWSARLWTTISLEWNASIGGYWYSNGTAFLMQISLLIFAPAFLSAFWYIELGYIIRRCGPQYVRVTPKLYAITFICGDIASLVVQALGGGIASAAPDLDGANRGAKIMVAGVIIQMVVMIAYSAILLEFVVRYLSQRPVGRQFRLRRTKENAFVAPGSVEPADERKLKVLIAAMVFSTLLIFVRSIYRTVELLDGWTGPIISDETLFAVLDGLMVFLAIAVFNAVHPTYFFPRYRERDSNSALTDPRSNRTSRDLSEKNQRSPAAATPTGSEEMA